jgi:hypothetical protein
LDYDEFFGPVVAWDFNDHRVECCGKPARSRYERDWMGRYSRALARRNKTPMAWLCDEHYDELLSEHEKIPKDPNETE